LSVAYHNVFAEVTASQKLRVRLLPISSGVFAAKFLPVMPALTFQAMALAFDRLTPQMQETLMDLEQVKLCVFIDKELPLFDEAQRQYSGEQGEA